jgi:hypothetical protein
LLLLLVLLHWPGWQGQLVRLLLGWWRLGSVWRLMLVQQLLWCWLHVLLLVQVARLLLLVTLLLLLVLLVVEVLLMPMRTKICSLLKATAASSKSSWLSWW